jgi:dienelactone hydrolase
MAAAFVVLAISAAAWGQVVDRAVPGRLARVWPDQSHSAPDERLGRCRHLNMRFSMGDYPSRTAWDARAGELREHVRVSCGLLPEPARCPLNTHVFGKLTRDGYTIEKVYFESRPGFYVAGNLYRPAEGKGPFPAVASPHGHGKLGRLNHEPGRSSVPARCVSLARMGFVVFAWDMLSWNDSRKQIPSHTGIFNKPADELWGISAMSLQTWNTIRAIDFLQSLPDVDRNRIAVTGSSGGGTQTFMVMGIDPRVTAAAPVCMVSGIMQGGCECENAPLLRIETNNIEIAALMAPRPLIIPSATRDWTKETPKVEYPSIHRIYELFGAAGSVAMFHDDCEHGYNERHRKAVYDFFRKHVQGLDGNAPAEREFPLEKPEDMLVWQGRDLPEGARTPDSLRADIVAEARRQRDELLPRRSQDRPRFDATLATAYRHAILAATPAAEMLDVQKLGQEQVEGIAVTRMLLGRKGVGDRIPALLYRKGAADGGRPARPTCVAVCPDGKEELIDPAKAKSGPLLAALLDGGMDVLAIDTYLTGEFLSPTKAVKQKLEGKFFTTYNRTAVVERVQDILTAVAYAKTRGDTQRVCLVGTGAAGAWCVLASALAPADVDVAADLAGLGGDDDARWLADLFTPCLLKAGGIATAVAMASPRRMLIHNAGQWPGPASIRMAYESAGKPAGLTWQAKAAAAEEIAHWLKR